MLKPDEEVSRLYIRSHLCSQGFRLNATFGNVCLARHTVKIALGRSAFKPAGSSEFLFGFLVTVI